MLWAFDHPTEHLMHQPFTTITVDEPASGLKTILSFKVPDQRSGKLEVQYLHDYAGISSSIKLTANPIINFSGVVGTNGGGLGTDVSFDTKTGCFTKCNTRLSFCNADLPASLAVNDKGDTLNASYYHTVSPLTDTAVGGEISHSFSTNENTLTVGTQHSLDPLTMLKARVNNFRKARALLQHQWRPRCQPGMLPNIVNVLQVFIQLVIWNCVIFRNEVAFSWITQ
ncbi:voltage dependent anion channel 1 [Actinidia rufa]|uniref:Voltage dependent anion channel 1 n=1 Tax=Actinidia rufa TaxID=165716 RepID=A0A7J0EU40_9ERIC|nr:voltage dependent anion channel 1 [Actinidia rufa]